MTTYKFFFLHCCSYQTYNVSHYNEEFALKKNQQKKNDLTQMCHMCTMNMNVITAHFMHDNMTKCDHNALTTHTKNSNFDFGFY